MRETAVEQHLIKRVQALGGMCVKLIPTLAGIPDRLVILRDGPIYLVELKRPKGGKVSPIQAVRHDRLAKIGHPVPVLWTKEEVDQWIDSL